MSQVPQLEQTAKHTTPISWTVETYDGRVGLAMVQCRQSPDTISFYMLGRTRDDFPCGFCQVENAELQEYVDHQEERMLMLYIGMWPVETVRQWCSEVVKLADMNDAQKSEPSCCELRNGRMSMTAEGCSCRENVLLYVAGESVGDLPCQICEVDCAPIEEIVDAPIERSVRLPLGRIPVKAMQDLCRRALRLTEEPSEKSSFTPRFRFMR